ncbi:MAG: hypothetical protein JG764_1698 [Clostridiales bacterium]|nr:hypothetical protein [Clostridiales bacterium]
MKWFIVAASLAAIIYLYIGKRKPVKMDCTQDLFDYKKIHNDGLIELPGQRFRKVIQVYPINKETRSQREQVAIWENFRALINSLVFPATFIVQSTHLDYNDYTENVREELEKIDNRAVREYGEEYINYIQGMSENRAARAHKYYIILKIDVASDSVDSGVEVEDNTIAIAINAFLKAVNRPKKLSDEEAARLARSELDNMANVVQSYLNQIGVKSIKLNKKGIVDMGYTTYNRDLANVIRTKEVDDIEAFSLFTKSLTPELHNKIIDEGGAVIDFAEAVK